MHVLATAGHVDHGKSALVRALTGIEPDRWQEEHRRGLTIDLGYAWTVLPTGEELAFVDVPGHERFIGNMLAGLGPVPAVLFVVAADEGWRQQSSEHLAAVDALGIAHGLLAVTRSDLADPTATLDDARARLRATSLGDVEAFAVSARTGAGLADLQAALARLVGGLPTPRAEGRVRLWVDRSFSIRGSGTVVTGTLGEGALRVGDELEVAGVRVRVRGLQSLEQPRQSAEAVCRVAANLRGVASADVARGDVLLTPGAWLPTDVLDVRLRTWADDRQGGKPGASVSERLMLHAGTAAVAARVRPLGASAARLVLARPLPLVAGDSVILRDPGAHRIVAGALVLDADPPPLRRRGAAAQRGADLAAATGIPDPSVEVGRRGAMRVAHARALGVAESAQDGSVRRIGDWLVAESALATWAADLAGALERRAEDDPLEPRLTAEEARLGLDLPDRALLPAVVEQAGLELRDARVSRPGVEASWGQAEEGLRSIEARLTVNPFDAPERPDLAAAGLARREIAAAVRAGRLLRLPGDVLLGPQAPQIALQRLASLPQPFTLAEARRVLGTSRRVVVPLLEHLDSLGLTRRVDDAHREVRR